MERSGKRGKIPQQDWPSIIERYEAGETLASIARTYDCSPPAISYILSRSRARANTAATLAAAPSGESQSAAPPPDSLPSSEAGRPALSVGAPGAGAPEQGNGAALRGPSPDRAPIETNPPALRSFAPPGGITGNGAQNGPSLRDPGGPTGVARAPQEESRRTLHLSQGQGNGSERPSAGYAHGPEVHPREHGAREPREHESREREPRENDGGAPAQGLAAGPPAPRSIPAEPPRHQPVRHPPGPDYTRGNGSPLRTLTEPQPNPRDGGAINQALRERVHTDLTAFLTAFDAALADDTSESRAGLREATDRLLRAGARTRIELERLEARMPLPARDAIAAAPAWRQR